MRARRFPILLATSLMLASCQDSPLVEAGPEPIEVAALHAPPAAIPGTYTGEIGPGSSYTIVVPPSWNGDLLLYAHGYAAPGAESPFTPQEEALLAVVPTTGFAVAYSTFSEDGLAVKDGAQRTSQLRGIFVSKVGRPRRTFLAGGSMGGLIALSLAERFPQHYSGVLALCGMVGGTQAQVDYTSHVRVLFDALYPGVLPGSLLDTPPLTAEQWASLVAPAVTADPASALALAAVMAATFGTPIPFGTPEQLVQSIVSALAFQGVALVDVLDRTHGNSPFDNAGTPYVGTGSPLADAALNAAVARYEATPDATRYLQNHYQPTGTLQVPVFTLHNALDPVVPAFHETVLGTLAESEGSGDLLVQLTSALPYGHCAFDPAEVFGAFQALVAAAG